MDYIIDNGVITLKEKKYWILSGELNNFNIEELNDIIDDFENVIRDEYQESSFSENVVVVSFNRDVAIIEDYDNVLGKEPTQEIYEMLKAYRDALSGLT